LESHAVRRAVLNLTALNVLTDVRLVHGLPERELLRLAQDRDVDMLVIGSAWAAQPMPRLFLRNITEQVLLNTQRPVLVVRPANRGTS
jgi:nucleotide-binding universal stress UspA family protein